MFIEQPDKSQNARPFEHRCGNGTIFTASRCDFRGGITAKHRNGLPIEKLMQDISEMIGFHAVMIHPKLNGFAGYDCITYTLISD